MIGNIVNARLAHVSGLSSVRVGAAMTRDALTFDEGEGLNSALRALRARGVRRTPLPRRDGALAGMVSSDDLRHAIAAAFGALTEL